MSRITRREKYSRRTGQVSPSAAGRKAGSNCSGPVLPVVMLAAAAASFSPANFPPTGLSPGGEALAARIISLRGGSPDKDRYGRSLRSIHRGGRSLGEQLVSEGLAHRWAGRKLDWCG